MAVVGLFFKSDIGLFNNCCCGCTDECLKKNPLSGFSKLTWTELAKSVENSKKKIGGRQKKWIPRNQSDKY